MRPRCLAKTWSAVEEGEGAMSVRGMGRFKGEAFSPLGTNKNDMWMKKHQI